MTNYDINTHFKKYYLFLLLQRKTNKKQQEKVHQVRLVPSPTVQVPRIHFPTGYSSRTAGSIWGDGTEGVYSTLPTISGRTSRPAGRRTDSELALCPISLEIRLPYYGE